jgi:hypothetical protein
MVKTDNGVLPQNVLQLFLVQLFLQKKINLLSISFRLSFFFLFFFFFLKKN